MRNRTKKTLTILSLLAAAGLAFGVSGCKSKSSPGATSASKPAASASGKTPFTKDMPVQEAPKPPPVAANPLVGKQMFVDPQSLAMLKANALRKQGDATTAGIIDRIAQQPQGLWMGEWNSNIFRAVEHYVGRAKKQNQVPIVIAYNIPMRDCGQYSSGGLSDKEAYQRWIRNVAAGIGNDPAVVILEPDALGHFQECLDEQKQQERMDMLSDAVRVLRQNPNAAVYLDAGHARWVGVEEIARRLQLAGVEDAHGFSLNVSNYVSTEENMEYGKKVAALLGGKHFVIDTSRNGAGPYEEAKTEEEGWCNPPGRKIGTAPTTDTGEPLCDGFLWLKRPGESDGECRGGPAAGVFWVEQAVELAQ